VQYTCMHVYVFLYEVRGCSISGDHKYGEQKYLYACVCLINSECSICMHVYVFLYEVRGCSVSSDPKSGGQVCLYACVSN